MCLFGYALPNRMRWQVSCMVLSSVHCNFSPHGGVENVTVDSPVLCTAILAHTEGLRMLTKWTLL